MNSTHRLRYRLLAALAGPMAVGACGGHVETSGGGSGGNAANAGSGAYAGQGGNGAQGGSGATGGYGATGGSGATGGNGATGGYGATGGGGLGGTAGAGATGGYGATGGHAGAGATGGYGGAAGASGACTDLGAASGLTVCGSVDCNACGWTSWLSCWNPEDVPVQPNVDPGTDYCPASYTLETYGYELCPYQDVWFNSEPTVRDGQCCYVTEPACYVGRPLLVEGQARRAPSRARDDWRGGKLAGVRALSPEVRHALCEAWLADACYEHASVAAFARLTLQLMAHGAPPELLALSQQAGIDEVRHAELCFALASRFSNEPLGPGALPMEGALTDQSLEELAVSSFEEGCVGESLAALVAAEQRAVAEDADVIAALDVVVEDETRHAELSWRIVKWAIAVGGDPVRRRIAEAASKLDAGAERESEPAGVDRSWHAFGRLTPSEVAEVRRRGLAEVVAPCLEALLAVPLAA